MCIFTATEEENNVLNLSVVLIHKDCVQSYCNTASNQSSPFLKMSGDKNVETFNEFCLLQAGIHHFGG